MQINALQSSGTNYFYQCHCYHRGLRTLFPNIPNTQIIYPRDE